MGIPYVYDSLHPSRSQRMVIHLYALLDFSRLLIVLVMVMPSTRFPSLLLRYPHIDILVPLTPFGATYMVPHIR